MTQQLQSIVGTGAADLIGNHTRWNGQEAHSAFISGSARAPLTLRLAARGTGLTVLWLTVAVYFKNFPLPSMTAQQVLL